MARVLAAGARGLIPAAARAAHPLDIHLTLRFLGPLDPERVQAAGAAADALRGAPCTLRLDQAGGFPRARVLWCAPTRLPPALRDLAAGLEAALAARGFAPEPRPWRPHLTLARRFEGPPVLPWDLPVEWEVRELVLAYGRDGPPPRYVAARRWPLLPA